MCHFAWLFCLFFVAANVSALGRTRVFSKTRWRPSAGTLHSAVLWYDMVNSQKTLPVAKKIFNFSRPDQVKSFEGVATSFSRQALGKTIDVELREVATYFAEKIIKFAQQKRRDSTTFTCIFKTSDVQKTTVVEIQLRRSKSKKIAGELVMFGRQNKPPREIVNLLQAAVLDDSFLSKYFGTGLLCVGALFAWLKLKDFIPKNIFQDSSLPLRTEKKEKPSDGDKSFFARPLRDDAPSGDDDFLPIDDEDRPDGEGGGEPAGGGDDAAMPYDGTVELLGMTDPNDLVGSGDGEKGGCGGGGCSCERLSPAVHGVGPVVGLVEKKDASTQVELPICCGKRRAVFWEDRRRQVHGAALYKAIIELCDAYLCPSRNLVAGLNSFISGRRRQHQDNIDGCWLTKQQTCLFDDGSILFVCRGGRARIVVCDSWQHSVIDRLRQEQLADKCDLVVILHEINIGAVLAQHRKTSFRDEDIVAALKEIVPRHQCFDAAKESNFVSCAVFLRERQHQDFMGLTWTKSVWNLGVLNYDARRSQMNYKRVAEEDSDIRYEIINFVRDLLRPEHEKRNPWERPYNYS